jgi:hypothetical protein
MMDQRQATAAEAALGTQQPSETELFAKTEAAKEAAKRLPKVLKSIYIVQRKGEAPSYWQDVLTVTVPARSHRSSILADAIRDLESVTAADRFRLLDERSATVMGLREKERKEPEFEVVVEPLRESETLPASP